MIQLDLFMDVERREIDTESVDLSKLTCTIEPTTRQKAGMKNTMDLVLLIPEGKYIAYKTGAYHPYKDKYPDPVYPYIVNTHTGREVSVRLGRNDYPCLNLSLANTGSDRSQIALVAHRLFCWCFIHNPDQNVNLVVDHINSDKNDYRIDNLEWVSQSENQRRVYK